jgi:hypothetical protein
LKDPFFDLTQVAFWDGRKTILFRRTTRPFETSLSRLRPSRIFEGQKAENVFAGQGDPLKHRFLDLDQVEFWAGQKAENDFAVPVDTLKHPFHDLAKFAFLQ